MRTLTNSFYTQAVDPLNCWTLPVVCRAAAFSLEAVITDASVTPEETAKNQNSSPLISSGQFCICRPDSGSIPTDLWSEWFIPELQKAAGKADFQSGHRWKKCFGEHGRGDTEILSENPTRFNLSLWTYQRTLQQVGCGETHWPGELSITQKFISWT